VWQIPKKRNGATKLGLLQRGAEIPFKRHVRGHRLSKGALGHINVVLTGKKNRGA